MKPTLKSIIATGFPGNAYPTISSAITLSAICWFVIAWMIPTGMTYTNAMPGVRNGHDG